MIYVKEKKKKSSIFSHYNMLLLVFTLKIPSWVDVATEILTSYIRAETYLQYLSSVIFKFKLLSMTLSTYFANLVMECWMESVEGILTFADW